MKDNKKTYWKGIEQLSNDPEYIKHAHSEFPEYLPINKNKENGGEGSSRRDFLKMMGFGIAAASLAACETPVRKAIPYLNKPVEIDPGIPNYYASTYINGGDCCSIVVKTREGRPIKLAGNDLSKVFEGAMFPQVEASVLSLYDQERLSGPYINGKATEWETLDKEVISKLTSISNSGGQIRFVSNTVVSPTTQKAINNFTGKFGTARHISYDSRSVYGMLKANQASFGQAIIPSYDFSKAKVIVSFGADFLGTWVSPIEFTKQYSKTRKLGENKKTMSRHFQFESNLSITGSNADYRTMIKPSQEGLLLGALYNMIVARTGGEKINSNKVEASKELEKAAKELLAARGSSLVVSGSNDPDVQVLVNAINNQLGNYGSTIDISTPLYMRQGNDEAMTQFVDDLKAGRIAAVVFYNTNPVYDHPRGQEIGEALKKVKLSITTNDRMDETASLVQYVAPDHHYLESWNDAEPKKGYLSIAQPAITPIFNTRQAQSSFLTWAGNAVTDFYTYLQDNWNANYYTNQSGDFLTFWNKSLFDGVIQKPSSAGVAQEGEGAAISTTFNGNAYGASQRINKKYTANNPGIELALYEKVSIGTGSQANNPWLQELPDAVTKACWDNYLTVSKSMADELGVAPIEGKTGMVKLTVNGVSVTLPALVQPGQAKGTVGLALGYGRTKAGKVANGVGVDAFPFVRFVDGTYQYEVISAVKVEKAEGKYQIAQTQTQQTYMGRENVIQESILSAYVKDPQAGKFQHKIATSDGYKAPGMISLWDGHKYPNHHWGMVIDLNSCTGCGTCVVSCSAENNVPVVGKDEVVNRRDMFWLRIDRYYSSDGSPDDIHELEIASQNPEVTFQPMLCQHCNNAPCETVCPVVATTHSTEGLNQMTYNRCVGTRYCANNCPYKVRRFNWFKYHDNVQFPDNLAMNNDLGKMVLNPDVTVRARGVMEKCSMCVQRIQAGKLQAKKENRRPVDGEIVTACANACPADAILFGDMNDENSRIAKLLKSEVEGRAYHVLEELNTKPNISYLRKIRNKDEQDVETVTTA